MARRSDTASAMRTTTMAKPANTTSVVTVAMGLSARAVVNAGRRLACACVMRPTMVLDVKVAKAPKRCASHAATRTALLTVAIMVIATRWLANVCVITTAKTSTMELCASNRAAKTSTYPTGRVRLTNGAGPLASRII